MASRRKYKAPKGYKDGGAVIPDHVVPPPPDRADVPQLEENDAVKRALEATVRAEEWHRQQAAQPPSPDAIIDAIPGISSRQRSFLKANPSLVLNDEHRRAATSAYQAALRSGIDADSEAMDQHMLEGVRRLHQQRVEAEPSMPPPPIERAADHPQSRRSSIPMSAPVSRDVPTASGRRMSELGNITLSAAEREIARYSFSSDLSIEERERLYAANKYRMLSMRVAGTLNELSGIRISGTSMMPSSAPYTAWTRRLTPIREPRRASRSRGSRLLTSSMISGSGLVTAPRLLSGSQCTKGNYQ